MTRPSTLPSQCESYLVNFDQPSRALSGNTNETQVSTCGQNTEPEIRNGDRFACLTLQQLFS
jgi:hypothetical protein